MPIPIGQVALTGKAGIFVAPSTGIQGLIISNESPYTITLNLQGSALTRTLLPETVDFFPAYSGFNGNVSYSLTTTVTNPSAYTQNNLFFEAVGATEQFNQAQYPLSLSRQAVTATASGKPLFTAKINIASTAGQKQSLNIFNPSTSGVNFSIFSIPIFTDDGTEPTGFASLIAGANLALPSSTTAISHTGSASPPTSAAVCSFDDSNTDYSGGAASVYAMHLPQKSTQDLLAFPDQLILTPGANLLVDLASGSNGHTVLIAIKWSEGN